MTDKLCLTCVWYDGDEHAVQFELLSDCKKRNTRVYADDTCAQHKDYIQPKAKAA